MTIKEGEENKEFWDGLGGKAEYATGVVLKKACSYPDPRLFQVLLITDQCHVSGVRCCWQDYCV